MLIDDQHPTRAFHMQFCMFIEVQNQSQSIFVVGILIGSGFDYPVIWEINFQEPACKVNHLNDQNSGGYRSSELMHQIAIDRSKLPR